jgi:hypothetical protein
VCELDSNDSGSGGISGTKTLGLVTREFVSTSEALKWVAPPITVHILSHVII